MKHRFFENWVVTNPFAGWERRQSVKDNPHWKRIKKCWGLFEDWCGRKIDHMTPPGFEWKPVVNWSVVGMSVCLLISLLRFGERYGYAWLALKWDQKTLGEYQGYMEMYYGTPWGDSPWFFWNGKAGKERWMSVSEYITVIEDGEILRSFSWVMEGVMAPFVYLMAIILLMAILHYLYFYHESKSIYLMKRLPNRMEIHRRSLAFPLTLIAVCVVTVLLLVAIYFGIYHLFVPARCIEPGQFSDFLREGIFNMWRGDGL